MEPMGAELKEDRWEELRKNLARLQTLRDEMRVRIHLAELDARDQWDRLVPQISRIESDIAKAAGEVSDTSREMLIDLIKKVEKMLDTLRY